MGNKKRGVYRIKFRPQNGRDGGYGDVQTFKASAGSPEQAAQKIRTKNVRVISVRLLYK